MLGQPIPSRTSHRELHKNPGGTKLRTRIAVCCLLLTFTVFSAVTAAHAQAKTEAKPTFASVLNKQFSGLEGELVPAAEAMPADKFSFAPSLGEFKGVRNFGSQIKHIAAVNYMVGAAILGNKPPAEVGEGEDGPATVKSKDEIVKYLKDSFAYAHKALEEHHGSQCAGAYQGPLRARHDHAPRVSRYYDQPSLRSLRADCRILANEWHYSAGQPTVATRDLAGMYV